MRILWAIRAAALVLALAACTTEQPAPNAQATPSARSVIGTRDATATPTASPSASTADCMSGVNNGYCYGFGTYYVATRRNVPRNWGNAASWYARAQADGYKVGTTPKKGAIACTSRGPYGQVAIVEDVSADGKQVTISEMFGKGGWNKVTTSTVPAEWYTYIY